MTVRLAVGVITWQDGADNLVDAWESCELADPNLILLCDGVIDGVDPGGLPDTSDLPSTIDGHGISFLNDRPVTVLVESHRWPSQSAKRSWLLDAARAHGCDWLLQIDADERLHNAHLLPAYLDRWPADAFPVPFEVDPGIMLGATWKCLRVDAWRQVVAGGAFIEHTDGQVYCVVPPGNVAPGVERFDNFDSYKAFLPWLSHHPELRPEGRRQIRLGEVEHDLEPPPAVPYFVTPGFTARNLLPSATVNAATDDATPAGVEYACTACGARYATPGICEQGHEPAPLVQVGDVPAADVELESDAIGSGHELPLSSEGEASTATATATADPAAADGAADVSTDTPAAPDAPAAVSWHNSATDDLEQAKAALANAAAALDAANVALEAAAATVAQAG